MKIGQLCPQNVYVLSDEKTSVDFQSWIHLKSANEESHVLRERWAIPDLYSHPRPPRPLEGCIAHKPGEVECEPDDPLAPVARQMEYLSPAVALSRANGTNDLLQSPTFDKV